MVLSWSTIKSVLLLIAPLLLPKAIAFYRSVHAAPATRGIPVRPLPPTVSRGLVILAAAAFAFLLKSLPYLAPENVFSLTSSRLQIPNDVLFTRLSAIRPAGLSPEDEVLRSRLNSLESRLLYFQFGPDVITGCPACNVEDRNSYLYFALTSILAFHLFNLGILALATSGLFSGRDAATWRAPATIRAVAVAMLDVYILSSYDHQGNARATRLEDIDTFFWKMRLFRGIGLAVLDGVIGWLIYLSSTNRAFLNLPKPAERIEDSLRSLELVRSKLHAMGIVRNTVNRDDALRKQNQAYWAHEGRLMSELMEEREVIEGVNNALENRINLRTITADAETYAQNVVASLQPPINT